MDELLLAHKKYLPQFADKIAELEAEGVTIKDDVVRELTEKGIPLYSLIIQTWLVLCLIPSLCAFCLSTISPVGFPNSSTTSKYSITLKEELSQVEWMNLEVCKQKVINKEMPNCIKISELEMSLPAIK